jgi:hypothetical protein
MHNLGAANPSLRAIWKRSAKHSSCPHCARYVVLKSRPLSACQQSDANRTAIRRDATHCRRSGFLKAVAQQRGPVPSKLDPINSRRRQVKQRPLTQRTAGPGAPPCGFPQLARALRFSTIRHQWQISAPHRKRRRADTVTLLNPWQSETFHAIQDTPLEERSVEPAQSFLDCS